VNNLLVDTYFLTGFADSKIGTEQAVEWMAASKGNIFGSNIPSTHNLRLNLQLS
jgi:hypothetical protein